MAAFARRALTVLENPGTVRVVEVALGGALHLFPAKEM
jgi:hypothetical protein